MQTFTLVLSIFLSSVSFAQKSSTSASKQVVANGDVLPSWRNCTGSYLECAKRMADADLATVKELIRAEANKTDNYSACTLNALEIRKTYDQWFVDHYAELSKINTDIDTTFRGANQKIADLMKEQFEANPVEGQKTSAKLTLQSVIEYFKILNARLKNCKSTTERELLMTQQENPDYNSLGIAHSQVIAAIQSYTTNLNASLKEHGSAYGIHYRDTGSSYALDFVINAQLGSGSQRMSYSLLSSNYNVQITEAQKWGFLSTAHMDKTSIDGLARYRQIYAQKHSAACPPSSDEALPSGLARYPFILQADIAVLRKTAPVAATASQWTQLANIPQGNIADFDLRGIEHVFYITKDGKAYYNGAEVQMPQNATPKFIRSILDLSDYYFIGTASGDMLFFQSTQHYGGGYYDKHKAALDISAPRYQATFSIAEDGSLLYTNANNQVKVTVNGNPLPALSKIAAAMSGMLYGLTSDGRVVEINYASGPTITWSPINVSSETSDSQAVSLTVNDDGTVDVLTEYGDIFEYNPSDKQWKLLAESNGESFIRITSDHRRTLYGITANGEVLSLERP